MKIPCISSKKLGDSFEGLLKNNNLYNNKELFDDGDLNWYDYGFRNYDPQIGRFMQLSPLTDNYPFLTPYQYASNDPITNIDIDGLEGISSTGLVDVMVTCTIRSVHLSAEVVTQSGTFVSIATKTIVKAVQITNIVVKTVQVGVTVTTNQLIQINPGGNQSILKEEADELNKHAAEFGVNTKQRMAHFLAQTGSETDGGNDLNENSNYGIDVLSGARFVDGISNHFKGLSTTILKSYVHKSKVLDRAYGNRMGNSNEASGDGSKYRGRGLTQITGKANYLKFTNWYQDYSNDYTINFVNDPELLSSSVKMAVLSGLWDWSINMELNKIADSDNVDKISIRLNGGKNGLEDRQMRYKRAKVALRLNP